MMNRNRYVSYKLAKLLNSFGFKEKTIYQVFNDNSLGTSNELIDWNDIEGTYSAPSLSQVSDWLLDNYNIFIDIEFISNNFDMSHKFKYFVIDTTKDDFEGNILLSSFERYKTKYLALEDALIKYIEKKLDDNHHKTNETTIKKEKNIEFI